VTDHKVNIYRAARDCGVTLLAGHLHSPASRKPRFCFCKPTVRDVGKAHGEAHLKLVLALLTGTDANAMHLYADVIWATSEVLAHNEWLMKSPTLLSDFDCIDIGALRATAHGMACGIPKAYVIRVLLLQRLSERS